MSDNRPKKRRGRPRITGVPAKIEPTTTPPVSLPLPDGDDQTLSASDMKKELGWSLPQNSSIKDTVGKILAMRLAGMEDAEIAKVLGLSPKSISPYMYRAGKMGWLAELDDVKARVEYELLPKVVRNLNEALDSQDNDRKDKTTLEVAKGTLFKKFGETIETGKGPQTIIGIKIETVPGANTDIREGTTGGRPFFLETDGETE